MRLAPGRGRWRPRRRGYGAVPRVHGAAAALRDGRLPARRGRTLGAETAGGRSTPVVRRPPGRAVADPAGANSRCRHGWRPFNTVGAVRARSGVASARRVVRCTSAAVWRPRRRVVPHVPDRRLPARRVELPVPIRLAAVRHGGAVRVGNGLASAPAGGASRAGTAGCRTGVVPCARKRSGIRVRGRASRAGTAGCRTGVVPCARKRSGIRVRGRASRAGTAGCRTGVVPCAPVRASRADGWCSSGRCGRARAGWCLSRCGRARTGWCWGRCGLARAGVVLVGAGVAWAVPASGYAGENRWSLIRRAAPMTPAVGPNSPRTMGRLPVAKGSDPR
ncbi:hypothetical protein SALBM217S_10462 [Streptomyces griseoloalbus]